VRRGFAGFVGLLAVVAGLILLLASANVAGLLLARGVARRREMAVRLALGAGRGRLVGQLLTESLLLAGAAGVLGLALAWALTRAIAAFRPPLHLPLAVSVEADATFLAFAAAASLATALAFGLAPALAAGRAEVAAELRGGRRAAAGRASRLRQLLLAGQMALSLTLLVAAGLALASLAQARRIDVGFRADGQLIASLDVASEGYGEEAGREFFERLKERAEALPGVTGAGWAVLVPLSLLTYQTPVEPAGWEASAGATAPSIDYNFVGPGYLPAMGVPLLAGRSFEAGDRELDPPPVVVNRTFARRFFPGETEALGKAVGVFGVEHRIVGVAGDGKYFSLGEDPRSYIYLPLDRYYRGARTLHVRTAGDLDSLAAALRREIRALDSALPVHGLKPIREQLGFALLPSRLAAAATAAFAGLGLLLAAVGLYGVVAFWTGRRLPEIGVRLVLGARRGDILRLVVGQAVAASAAGLALGLAAGAALARLSVHLFHGVGAFEPGVFFGAAAVLGAAALAASLPPARRALRVDPATILRAE
jgi:predicted permease